MKEDKYTGVVKGCRAGEIFSMKAIRKEDFLNFVDALIKKESRKVIGVKSKGSKFVFDALNSADELRLDYDVTILPPKKYFLPQTEPLLEYDLTKKFSVHAVNEVTPMIIIGIHPYDLVAIQQIDTVFKEGNPDNNYIKKREESILIGVNIKNVSPYAFAGSMNTATTEKGFDIMLTDLGDKFAVELGSEKGNSLIEKYAKVSDAGDDIKAEVQRIKKEIVRKFKKQINFPLNELPELLRKNYDDDLWHTQSQKCLSCGSCNFVCPTCYCFDVNDTSELNMKKGKRNRTWDGCLLEDFALSHHAQIPENFRKEKAARYRHRFMRKGKYPFDKFGFIACVGCGRCASGCLPDIADPAKVFNLLKEVQK